MTQRTAMFDWVQHLLQLRAHTPELTHGQEQLLHIDDDTLLYVRGMQLDKGCDFSHNPRVLVAANKTAIPKQISFSVTNTALAGCNTADTKLGKITWPTAGADGMLTLTLPPGASIVRVH
jgi:glycosidase